jgi:hypothetical protein
MVLLIASWDHGCLPHTVPPIDPDLTGHPHKWCWHMRATCEPPAWGKEVVVTGDTGFCAHKTLRLIHHKAWIDVLAVTRTCKLADGKSVHDLGCHLPRQGSGRRAPHSLDGRRRDCWVCHDVPH